jgi:hypothetical protein
MPNEKAKATEEAPAVQVQGDGAQVAQHVFDLISPPGSGIGILNAHESVHNVVQYVVSLGAKQG